MKWLKMLPAIRSLDQNENLLKKINVVRSLPQMTIINNTTDTRFLNQQKEKEKELTNKWGLLMTYGDLTKTLVGTRLLLGSAINMALNFVDFTFGFSFFAWCKTTTVGFAATEACGSTFTWWWTIILRIYINGNAVDGEAS